MAAEARNRAELTAEVAASPDETFTYLTDHFLDLWPGRGRVLSAGSDPAEPMGLGMVREVKPAGSPPLEERIVAHERPRLIEYEVINEAPIHNHLGRLELTPTGSGTRLDYTITFDYKPAAAGPLAVRILKTTWALTGRRRMRADLGRP
jgi:uncharacterized protein YndB with AHSA1/START domain